MLMLVLRTNDSTGFLELSSRGDMEPPLEIYSASSSDGQADISNHIHVGGIILVQLGILKTTTG